MIEFIATALLFACMMTGLAIGIWLKSTPLTRHCGSARFMMNLQCLAGCASDKRRDKGNEKKTEWQSDD